MGYGPVIEAVEAGHYGRSQAEGPRKCGACGETWTDKNPCSTMVDARRQQKVYAETLRLRNLTAAENRKTYI